MAVKELMMLAGRGGGGTDVSDTTAVEADVRTGKYFHKADGSKVEGSIADQAAQTIHPSASDQTIASGKYLAGAQTIKGVLLTNLEAGNIKKDVVVKVGDSTDDDCVTSVTGTYEGGGGGEHIEDGIIDKTISGTYENSRVTSIGSYAFMNCVNLTNVSFPNVTSIGNAAFSGCSKITTVSIPSATSIGANAFNTCKFLTTVSFPYVTSIEYGTFSSCTSLTTVSIPSATSIGNYAFCGCYELTAISFPSATYIGSSAFSNCTNLTTVSIPSATTIGSYAFSACRNITVASFPYATSVYDCAFRSCRNLTTASFPLLTSINSYTFADCTSLSITYFPSVYDISAFAFGVCANLSTISFPNAGRIRENAFANCYNLLSLYLFRSSVAKLDNVNAFKSTPISNYTTSTGGVYGSIFVPSSLYATYIAANNWSVYADRFVSV